MRIFIIATWALLFAMSAPAFAQDNGNTTADIENNQQLALSANNFVKVSNNFTQTPYFPLLLGLAPYAATAVVGVPLVLAGTPLVLSFGLLGVANPSYLDTLNVLRDVTVSVYDISASVAAITLPIGVLI